MNNWTEIDNFFYSMGVDIYQIFFSALVGIAGYILVAVGLYTIAKRRGIRNPWLAWVPFGQNWLLGCVSDQYQHVAVGRRKSKRNLLLWLDICNAVLSVITIALLVNALFEMLRYLNVGAWTQYNEEYFYNQFEKLTDEQLMEIASSMMYVMIPAFLLMGVAITMMIIRYMALYDLYRSCEPYRATPYVLLSIFLSAVVTGILVFLSRNKDLGMQPRQPYGYQEPTQLPPEQNWQPPQNPWENNNQQW